MCWSALHNHSFWRNRGIGFFLRSARLYMGTSCSQLYCKYSLYGEGLDMLIDPSPSSAIPWKPLWRSPYYVNYSFSSSFGILLVPREFLIRSMLLLDTTISVQGRYPDRERCNASFNCVSKLRDQTTGHVRLRGRDGLESSQTALESANIRGKMVWRPIHRYGFEEDAYYTC